MGHPTKITTCCFCGARAALVLTGKTRHELACASCGAPLHDLKRLRKDRKGDRDLVAPSRIRVRPDDPIRGGKWDDRDVPRRKPKKKKRRKSLFSKVVEEAFDVIEDIFD